MLSAERSAPRGAVFLSYASQDAAAARRICEALRVAGVEVWLDQNELVDGDAWDAEIRKQIAGCALFVPIVSANTQAWQEGYFRLEWKLAAQRTHMMAEERAFLLPVAIDDTGDAEAKVPSGFKAVQWSRLRQAYGVQARLPPSPSLRRTGRPGDYGGLAPDDPALAAFVARVRALLAGADSSAGTTAVDGVRLQPGSLIPGAGAIPCTRPASARPATMDGRRRSL